VFLEVAASFLRAAREQESDDKDREANPNLPFQRLGSNWDVVQRRLTSPAAIRAAA
jgi:hypothetical protein